MSASGVPDVPSEALASICSRYRVRELSVFGSVARGRSRPDSDVHLLVTFEDGAQVGLVAFGRLQRELSDLFGRQVDLVPKDGLKAAVRGEVLSQARIL